MFVCSFSLGRAIADDTQGTGQRAATTAASAEEKQRDIHNREGGRYKTNTTIRDKKRYINIYISLIIITPSCEEQRKRLIWLQLAVHDPGPLPPASCSNSKLIKQVYAYLFKACKSSNFSKSPNLIPKATSYLNHQRKRKI